MNINDYASRYTRDEFLELAKDDRSLCPSGYKLNDININECEDGIGEICLKC